MHLKDFEQLKATREKLDLTQAQMAGMLGINRSYLAELESERRPVQKWILAKSQEIERRMRGVSLAKRPAEADPAFIPDGFAEFFESVAELTHDELMELSEYLHAASFKAPRSMATLYEIALVVTLGEFRSRLRLAGKVKRGTPSKKAK